MSCIIPTNIDQFLTMPDDDFEDQLSNRADQKTRRQDAVTDRRDYQVRDTPPALSARVHAKDSDLDRLYRYRDRLLDTVRGRIDAALFTRLDERSQLRLQSLPLNTEINQYADLCGYVEYCHREQLTPFPVTEYGLDAYLSHRMAQGHAKSSSDRCVASLVA